MKCKQKKCAKVLRHKPSVDTILKHLFMVLSISKLHLTALQLVSSYCFRGCHRRAKRHKAIIVMKMRSINNNTTIIAAIEQWTLDQ